MKKNEPNYAKVAQNFPDHVFSQTETTDWVTTDCKQVIKDNMDNITKLISNIKQYCPDTEQERNKAVKKLFSKIRLTRKNPGFNFKSTFGYNLDTTSRKSIKHDDPERTINAQSENYYK